MYYRHIESPVGRLLLAGNDAGIHRIAFAAGKRASAPAPDWQPDAGVLAAVSRQLGEYFAGQRRAFDLPLVLSGTPFQRDVLAALCEIPFAGTRSYADVARAIGKPKAVRAVGAANGRNPLPIVIPCHRVIGADGSLTGFGGGIETKRWLLAHERALVTPLLTEPAAAR